MDRDVIEQEIESRRRCVARVRQKCPATLSIEGEGARGEGHGLGDRAESNALLRKRA